MLILFHNQCRIQMLEIFFLIEIKGELLFNIMHIYNTNIFLTK